ncbi:hypothetical protein YDYSY3_34720 [Paenibacillus chitinolyticus]|nr:hypothetical protein YDYSY3_34720 [Paenibacillus chitinolyticus]
MPPKAAVGRRMGRRPPFLRLIYIKVGWERGAFFIPKPDISPQESGTFSRESVILYGWAEPGASSRSVN